MSFKFHPEIRPHVEATVKLMEYANSKESYLWCGDVYGHASKALDAIILATMGDKVMDKINHMRHGYNFGGNYSWLEDVEVAIQTALDEIAEDEAESSE